MANMSARIATYVHRPKRLPKKKTAAPLSIPAVVKHVPRKRGREQPVDASEDPEAEERMRKWILDQLRPPGKHS
jgi:hypothetical protein